MAGFSIGLGKEKSKTSQNSTTNRTLNEVLSGRSSSTTAQNETIRGLEATLQSALGDESMTNLRMLIQQVQQQATPEAQQRQMQAAIANVLDQGMAGVIAEGTNAGAYDSTVQGQAGQKLASRAANEGAAQQVAAQQGFLQQVVGLLGVEKGAQLSSTSLMEQLASLFGSQTTEEEQRRTANETTKTKGSAKTSGSSLSGSLAGKTI